MVKLVTARAFRLYGPHPSNAQWEHINAGVYIFASVLLIGGFAAEHSSKLLFAKSGLAVVIIGLILMMAVNFHDLAAHAAAIDYRLALAEFDVQLALVEFAVPIVQIIGISLFIIAVIFFEIQMERGYRYKLEKHGLNLLIAAPVFWIVGSVHNICQIYERVRGHVQILQKSVQVPLLLGSVLFLIGGIVNRNEVRRSTMYSFMILSKDWAWFCLFGSALFAIGGFMNLVKVFALHRMDGTELERLRGGALERLRMARDGQAHLMLEEGRRKDDGKRRSRDPNSELPPIPPLPGSSSYRDVLLGGSKSEP